MGQLTQSMLEPFNNSISGILNASTETDVCREAVSSLSETFDTDIVGLWLYDTDAKELQLTAQTKKADRLFGRDIVYKPGNSESWRAFETNEVVELSRKSNSNRYNPESILESEIIVPIDSYGVINIARERDERFDESDIEVAKAFGTVVNTALDHINETHAMRVKNDQLEEVISLVTHDVRNPLNVAQGRVDIAADQVANEETNNHLSVAADSLGRIETLIEDLLLLAEQGYVVEDRTQIELSQLANEAWSNVVTDNAELAVVETAKVFGERKRLLQVFENLFRNAIEHGGTNVTVKVRPIRTGQETEQMRQSPVDGFLVEDDGEGLPDESGFNLFESGVTTSGNGLGLSIVQRIIEAHGWDISATTAQSGGARFEIVGAEKSVTPFE